MKNSRYRPVSCFISEMIQDRATVTTERQQELTCDLSNGAISNDLEWLSEIFNDTKHRAVSQRPLSFLFSSLDNSFPNATLTAGSQLHRIQKTTENNHVSDGLRRIVTFFIIAPYKYSYLLTYLSKTTLFVSFFVHLSSNIFFI